MRFLVLFLLLVAPVQAAELKSLDNIEALRAEALALVNKDRRRRGLKPLVRDPLLEQVSQEHADDMARRNYFKHRGRDGRSPRQRYRDAGGSRRVGTGENLAWCGHCAAPEGERVKRMHRMLMKSRGHKQNILGRGYRRFGYGIAFRPTKDGRGRAYAVQTFSATPPKVADHNAAAGVAAGAAAFTAGPQARGPQAHGKVRRVVRKKTRRRLFRWPFGRKRK